MMELLKEISVQQAIIAEDFFEMYEPKAALYSATLRNQDIAKQLDTARTEFEKVMKADVIDPISKYLGQYKEIKERIEIRNTRKVDMDRYSRDYRIHEEKAQVAKANAAKQKYETAKSNYTALNDELLRDLPALYEDRIPFFDPALATYSTSLAEYYKEASRCSSEVLSYVSNVDRQLIHSHPRVTTPTEQSSSKHTYTVAPSSSSSSSPSSSSSSFPSSYPPSNPHSSYPPSTNNNNYSINNNYQPSAPSMESNYNPKPFPVKASFKSTFNPPKNPPLQRAQALFDFVAQEDNELSFKFNDIIIIHNMKGDWWEGELNGRRGLLPSNYVKLLN
jgi:hypothetical protein